LKPATLKDIDQGQAMIKKASYETSD